MNNPVHNQSPLSISHKEVQLPSKISKNSINAKFYDNSLLNYAVLALKSKGGERLSLRLYQLDMRYNVPGPVPASHNPIARRHRIISAYVCDHPLNIVVKPHITASPTAY